MTWPFRWLIPLALFAQFGCKKTLYSAVHDNSTSVLDSSAAVVRLCDAITSATRHETVILKADKPWEAGGLVYFSIFQQDSLIRLYYLCEDTAKVRHVCYAYSYDGINFVKPNLNTTDFNGSRDNNILDVDLDQVSFFFDNSSSYPFRLLGMRGDMKLYYAYSNDGIHFKLNNDPIVDYFADTQNQIIYDPFQRKYKYYLRSYVYDTRIAHPFQKYFYYRAVSYFESTYLQDIKIQGDPIHHPEAINLFSLSTELPTILNYDRSNLSECDIYKPSVVMYNDSVYIAYASVFHHYPKPNDGYQSIALYVSTNGENFTLVQPNFINDEPHSYYMAPGYATKNGILYNYYWKVYTTHAEKNRVSEYVAEGYQLNPQQLSAIKN